MFTINMINSIRWKYICHDFMSETAPLLVSIYLLLQLWRGTYFSYGLKKNAIYLKRSYINSCCLAGQERDQAKQDQSDLKGNYLRQLYFFLSSGEFVNYS